MVDVGKSRKKGVSLSYKLLLCSLLTLFVMYLHQFLPPHVLAVVPSKNAPMYIYSDPGPDGSSLISWIDYDERSWRCVIPKSDKQYGCGFNVALGGGLGTKGLDLSGYESVNVDLEYKGGDKRLRFYIRDYEPGFSDINEIQTAKFINAYVPTSDLSPTLNVALKEFYVAE